MFDKEAMEGLSEAERAALEEEVNEEQALDEDEAEETEESEGAVEAQAEEEPAAAEEPGDKEVQPFKFVYNAELPENYEDAVKNLQAQKKELRSKFTDGELDLEEYEEARDKVEQEERVLNEARLKVDLAAEQKRQEQEQRWVWEQENFFSKKANQAYLADPILSNALDFKIKELANNPDNSSKSMKWVLDEADRQVRLRLQVPGGDKNKAVASASRNYSPPPNIGDMPTADINDTADSSPFAHIDRLKGLAREAALAKLTDEEVDRYLQGE